MPLPIINRLGGKYFNHKYFTHLFPDAKIYVEPFIGGGSVFVNKKKKYEIEVINDLDGRLINFYKYMKDTPDAESVDGNYTKEQFLNLNLDDPIDYFKRMRLSFRTPKMFNTLRTYINHSKKHFKYIHENLKDVEIYNLDYLDIIDKFDSVDTFFYLDPPYENSVKTIKTKDLTYTDIDLSILANKLKTIQGKFLITLNDSDVTRDLFKDFNITTYTAYYARTKKYYTELIIQN